MHCVAAHLKRELSLDSVAVVAAAMGLVVVQSVESVFAAVAVVQQAARAFSQWTLTMVRD